MRKFFSLALGRYLALLLTLVGLWFALSGYFTKPALIGLGVVSIFITMYLAGRANVLDPEGVPTRIFPGILGYMVWLTLEIGKANFLVAKEIIKPKLALSPKMIRVQSKQASDVGRTIFGNSITLTPGTVTVDVEEDWVLVHALTEDLADVDGIHAMGEKVCAFDRPDGSQRTGGDA